MVTFFLFAIVAGVVALIAGFATGKDRYSEISEEEFEAEAQRISMLGAAVMGLHKILEPNRVEYIMQRDKCVEGNSAEAARPAIRLPADGS